MPRVTPIATGDAPAAVGPYAQAVAAGEWIFCSGQIPLDPVTGELVTGDIQQATDRALRNLGAVLAAAGAGPEHVVKTTLYLTDMNDFGAVNTVYARFFGDHRPARACVQVSALPRGAAIEIEAVARR